MIDMKIFISYSKHDAELAGELKRTFEFLDDNLECFIAHDDIDPGSDWEKEIIRNLEAADIFMPLQTNNLVGSFWCQQEAGFAIKRGINIIPLKPTDAGVDPIGFYKKYQAAKVDISDIVKSVGQIIKKIDALQLPVVAESSQKAKVQIGYKDVLITPDLHQYHLQFGVENLMSKSPENVIVEIKFPAEYVKREDWKYPHLTSRVSVDPKTRLRWLYLNFNYLGLTDAARRQTFDMFILPKKTLWIFGNEPPFRMTDFEYFVNHENWKNRHLYNVEWEVFFTSGESVATGTYPFEKLQKF